MKPAPKPLGLYIHIPFCKHKCAYCDFYSLSGREDRMDDYQKALLAHIKELTGGESFASNVQLALNNARCAARIAVSLAKM